MDDSQFDSVLKENSDALARLEQQLESPYRVLPFVGAGVSMAFEYPGWSGFLRKVGDRVGCRIEVDAMLLKAEFEEAADLLIEKYGEHGFYADVARSFGRRVALERKLDGVLPLLRDLTAGPLATTNFDSLIERTYEERSLPLSVIRGTDVDSGTLALMLAQPCLLKLHGGAEERNGRIFTRAEYDQHYGPKGSRPDGVARLPLPGLLHRLMSGHAPLLFIGCSLLKDRTLDILEEVQRVTAVAGHHYAFVQIPSDESTRPERRIFCSKHGIHPIWYPAGEHHLIARMLEHVLARGRRAEQRARQSEPMTEVEARVEARIDDLAKVFHGRATELSQIEADANSAGCPVIVTAEAGHGKSALLATFVKRLRARGASVAVHFFSRLDGLTSPTEAYVSLTTQIRRMLGATRNEGPAGRDALWAALQLWAERKEELLYLVVDSLDEAEGAWRRPGPAKLLPHVAMIVSARAGEDEEPPDLGEWLIGAKRSSFGALLLLPEDVSAWLQFHPGADVRRLHSNAMVDALMDKSGGIALHLKLLIDALAEAIMRGEPVGPTLIRDTPEGLEAYVSAQLHHLLREGGLANDDARRWFSLLCAAHAPLSARDLSELTGTSILALPWSVTRWFTIRREQTGTTTYRFTHDFLASQFAEQLYAWVQRAEADLLDYCRKWRIHRSEYSLRYLGEHLSASGERAELEALAQDDDYGSAQLAAFPNEPELRLRLFQKAVSAVLDAGDVPHAATLLLEAARISEKLKRAETPLSALRAGSLIRARALANLDDPARRVLWELLLAWELFDAKRAVEATDLLSALTVTGTLEMRGWPGRLAVLVLPNLTFAGGLWRRLVSKLLSFAVPALDSDAQISDVGDLLIERNELDAARELGMRASDELALAYVAGRRYDDATATVQSLAPKQREQRLLRLSQAAIESGDVAQARQWFETSRAAVDPTLHPGYAERLAAMGAAIGTALGESESHERLLEPRDDAHWITAIAHAAALTTRVGGRAEKLWEHFERALLRTHRDASKILILAGAAEHAVGVEHLRAQNFMIQAERLATSLESDLARDIAQASEVWEALARLRAKLGDLEGGLDLLAKIRAPYSGGINNAFAALTADVAAKHVDAAVERALAFLEAYRRRRNWSPSDFEARLDIALPVLKVASASNQSVAIRNWVNRLLREAQQATTTNPKSALGEIAETLIAAQKLTEAHEVATRIPDAFSSKYWRSRVAIGWAAAGEIGSAREVLGALGDTKTLSDPVYEAIAARLAAEDDIAGAQAVLPEMSWGRYELTRAKMMVLAAQLRTGDLPLVEQTLPKIENSNEVARTMDVLGAALPSSVPGSRLEAMVPVSQDPLERLMGFASLGVGLAAAGRESEADSAFSRAADEAPRATAYAREERQHVFGSESRPWVELAIAYRKARRKELGTFAFGKALRFAGSGYDRDEIRRKLSKALAALGETDEAFALVRDMHVEPAKIRGALTAVATALKVIPEGFVEHVEGLCEGKAHSAWAARIWAAIGDEARLRRQIEASPLDVPLAQAYSAALARWRPDHALAIAETLLPKNNC